MTDLSFSKSVDVSECNICQSNLDLVCVMVLNVVFLHQFVNV